MRVEAGLVTVTPAPSVTCVTAASGSSDSILLHMIYTASSSHPSTPFVVAGTGNCPDSCGKWNCFCCVNRHLSAVKISCGNYACPNCFQLAAGRDAQEAEERLRQARRLLGISHKVQHYEFSFPEDVPLTSESFKKMKARILRLLKRYGAEQYGGVLAFHAYRLTEQANRRYQRSHLPHEGEWDWWRKQGDRDALVRPGPHFHFVGYLYLQVKSDEFYRSTGIVYKRLSVLPDRDVYQAIKYVLSHKAVIPGLQTHSWVGVCSRNKLGYVVTHREREQLFCGKCAEPLYRIREENVEFEEGVPQAVNPPRNVEFKVWLEGHRPHTRLKETRRWFVRTHKRAPPRAPERPVLRVSQKELLSR